MTTDEIGISRRNVLAGLGAIGVASAGAGLGTTAYFSDEQEFTENTITAGELALSVTWQQLYRGAPQAVRPGDYGTTGRPFVNAYPDHDGSGLQSFLREDETLDEYAVLDGDEDDAERELAAVEGRNLEFACDEIATFDEPDFAPNEEALIVLADVKPGDCGEITFGLKLCDNPGYVWLRGLLGEETDGGHSESEGAQLADEIVARAWYDDGDNVFQPDEPQIVSGSLRDVLTELSGGRMLQYDPEVVEPPAGDVEVTGDAVGSVEVTDDASECVELPKEDDDDVIDGLAPGDEFVYETDDGDVVITLTDVDYKGDGSDQEAVGFSWESNVPICQLNLKGGPEGIGRGEGIPTLYDCATSGTVATTLSPGGEQYAISNFRFYYCVVDEENGNGENDNGENGDEPNGEVPNGDCFQPSNTRFVAFEWCLPTSVGNEVQGDAVSFDLSFYTEQCRHNPDPVNPWEAAD